MSIPVKVLIPVLAIFAVAAPLGIRKTDALPQVGDADPVAVVLGDVRMLVGRKMIRKADEYFHGGVTGIDCSHEHPIPEHGHEGVGHEAEGEHEGHEDAVNLFAPWHFVTDAVRLPPVERHLEGEASRELLPWLWAACCVDSGNVNAYANAAYVVEAMNNSPEKALGILTQGIEANPSSAELEFQKGQLLLKLKKEDEAIDAFRAAYEKSRTDSADDNDLTALRALGYLGNIAARNGDDPRLEDCREKAKALSPTHSITLQLQQLELKSK